MSRVTMTAGQHGAEVEVDGRRVWAETGPGPIVIPPHLYAGHDEAVIVVEGATGGSGWKGRLAWPDTRDTTGNTGTAGGLTTFGRRS